MKLSNRTSHEHASQEREVAPLIADFWERAEFPHQLIPKLAALNLGGGVLRGHGCAGQSILGAAMANVEMARVDGSMSTYLMVHNSLAMLTIGERAFIAQFPRKYTFPAIHSCISFKGD